MGSRSTSGYFHHIAGVFPARLQHMLFLHALLQYRLFRLQLHFLLYGPKCFSHDYHGVGSGYRSLFDTPTTIDLLLLWVAVITSLTSMTSLTSSVDR